MPYLKFAKSSMVSFRKLL